MFIFRDKFLVKKMIRYGGGGSTILSPPQFISKKDQFTLIKKTKT